MASDLKNIIILGASGNIGRPILDALLAAQNFNVTVAVRSASTLATYPIGVKTVTIDYDSLESLREAFKGQHAVVSCITTFEVSQQQKVINAAVAAGVKRFLPSEYGMDTSNPKGPEILPVLHLKRSQLEYLQSKENEGLSWTALIVGLFFDWALENGIAGYDFKNKKAEKFDSNEQRYEVTNVARIGHAVVKILEQPEVTKNEFVYIHSFNVTPNQVLAEIERATGGNKWDVEEVSLERRFKTGLESMSGTSMDQGAVMAISAVLMGYRNDVGLNDWNEKAQEWGRKLNLPDESLRSSVEAVVKRIEGKL